MLKRLSAFAFFLAALCSCVNTPEEIAVTGITVSPETLSLTEGQTARLTAKVLPEDATEKTITWSTSDASVASVEDGLVTAVSKGSATITATIGVHTATCTVTVGSSGPRMVDLGLSVLWADCNIGAEEPSDYGDYYAWGEIEPKDVYSWETYKWYDATKGLTKYNYNLDDGLVDNKTLLEEDDDVAHIKLGGKWRMPTWDEMEELVETRNDANYKWEWTSMGGHNGWRVTYHVNGNNIFLPATGSRHYQSLEEEGIYGDYWSSSLSPDYPDQTMDLLLGESEVGASYYGTGYRRYDGLAVRPVYGDFVPVKGITLDPSEISMNNGEELKLTPSIVPENATCKGLIWRSSQKSVVKVVDGLLTAVAPGTAIITVISSGFSATCTVSVNPSVSKVDLGLSVLWSDRNVGAESPSDYGDYYTWGEIEPKEDYSWDTYRWGNNYYSLTKYNSNSSYGIVDNKTLLEGVDDVAHVKFGGKWRMPTKDEINELVATRDNSSYRWEWKSVNDHDGWEVTCLTNGNSIFLPAAGRKDGVSLRGVGVYGYYGSSSLNLEEYTNGDVWSMFCSSSVVRTGSRSRIEGCSVRPVYGEMTHVDAIALDCSEVSFIKGAVVGLIPTISPANADEQGVNWSSSNESVAAVMNGLVTALSEGSTVITATTVDGGYRTSCSVSVKPIVSPEKVDIGLSVFWADRNLGAAEPFDYGGYYAWGETEPKYDYSAATYKWCDGTAYRNLTKYNTNADYGVVDNNILLDEDDDAAHKALGGRWRMPTEEEISELVATRDNSSYRWEWKSIGGHNGWEITYLDNGNSIFMPAAGDRDGTTTPFYTGVEGLYLSSSLSESTPLSAVNLDFKDNNVVLGRRYRYNGFSVRPVTK